jgi:hypothetical protein
MKTLRELMNFTPADVRSRAKKTSASVIGVSRISKKQREGLAFIVRCKAITEKTYYDVKLEIFPDPKGFTAHEKTGQTAIVYKMPRDSDPSWVQCSCPYFLFNCEYACAKHESSEIKYSNGKPPYITNPRQIPYLCKHLYKAAPAALSAIQHLAKSDEQRTEVVPTKGKIKK